MLLLLLLLLLRLLLLLLRLSGSVLREHELQLIGLDHAENDLRLEQRVGELRIRDKNLARLVGRLLDLRLHVGNHRPELRRRQAL